MASSTELLAAIVAAPDDDAPRLVYADWLLEHGEAARGNQIIAQCTLAECERTGDRTSLRYKHALLHQSDRLERGFLAEVSPGGSVGFEMPGAGLLPGLRVRLARFGTNWDLPAIAVRDLAPLRMLAETTPIDEIELRWEIGRMRFDGPGFIETVAQMADTDVVWSRHVLPTASFLPHLIGLELTDRSPPFNGSELTLPPTLRRLRMSAFAITPRLLRQVPRLERLEVFEATAEDAREIFAEWSFECLEALTVVTHGQQVGAGKLRAFGRPIATACVEVGATKGLKHLAASFPLDERMPLQSLETLRIVGGARGEIVGRLGPRLHRLSVYETDVVSDLADAPPPALSDLAFVDCTINGERARRIAGSKPLAQLCALSFHGCRHSSEPMRAILHSPTLAPIPRITIAGSLSAESRWRNNAWQPPDGSA